MRTRHILTAAVVTSLHFDSHFVSTVYAADVSWSNGAAAPSQNRWTVDTNWLNNVQPGSSDRAIIATGSGTRIQIRNGSSATASVGSIQINTAESAYSILNADGLGSDTASINFGTGSTTFTSRFDLDMSSGTDFVVGDDPAAAGGTLTLSNVGTLEQTTEVERLWLVGRGS